MGLTGIVPRVSGVRTLTSNVVSLACRPVLVSESWRGNMSDCVAGEKLTRIGGKETYFLYI